jgi:integrase
MFLRAVVKHAAAVLLVEVDRSIVGDALKGRWHRERPRQRILPPEAIGAWWRAFDELRVDHKPSGAFFRLLLATGLRPAELLAVKVEDFNGVSLKVHRTKTHDVQVLPLSTMAQGVIVTVIGKRKTGRVFDLFEPPRKALAMANKAAGVECSAYDLRRTHSTSAASLAPYPVVRQLMGHAPESARDPLTRHYAVASPDAMRAAVDAVGEFIAFEHWNRPDVKGFTNHALSNTFRFPICAVNILSHVATGTRQKRAPS